VWADVDLDALAHNLARIGELAGPRVRRILVVKADAYGHGAIAVARALADAKAVAGFAVSLVEEGVTLREAGVTAPILVMGPSQHGGEAEMIAATLTPVIASEADLAALAGYGGLEAHRRSTPAWAGSACRSSARASSRPRRRTTGSGSSA
jgi:alanine racemase